MFKSGRSCNMAVQCWDIQMHATFYCISVKACTLLTRLSQPSPLTDIHVNNQRQGWQLLSQITSLDIHAGWRYRLTLAATPASPLPEWTEQLIYPIYSDDVIEWVSDVIGLSLTLWHGPRAVRTVSCSPRLGRHSSLRELLPSSSNCSLQLSSPPAPHRHPLLSAPPSALQ